VALARLAAVYFGLDGRRSATLPLIGITGTNGKTTVAWLIRSVLRAAGRRPALLGTIEYDLVRRKAPAPLTTPDPLTLCRCLAEARDAGAEAAVLEVSSHALDQRRCDGLRFAVGVFTNLSGDHLDYHGDMEAYYRAKRRLFDLLDDGGTAIVNRDDPAGERLVKELAVPVRTYGVASDDAYASARIGELSRFASVVDITLADQSFAARIPLLGRHNMYNAVAAATASQAVGVGAEAIRAGLECAGPIPGRLERIDTNDCPFSVVVDYAHTDAALDSALTALRPITSGRLICVFGCGGDRDRGKRPRMGAVVNRLADVAFVTSDNPRTEAPSAIIDDILPGFAVAGGASVRTEPDRRSAIVSAIALARSGDTVLIAGKGHENYQIIGESVFPFDDAVVARDCLTGAVRRGEVA